jgi:hypothetical protein
VTKVTPKKRAGVAEELRFLRRLKKGRESRKNCGLCPSYKKGVAGVKTVKEQRKK